MVRASSFVPILLWLSWSTFFAVCTQHMESISTFLNYFTSAVTFHILKLHRAICKPRSRRRGVRRTGHRTCRPSQGKIPKRHRSRKCSPSRAQKTLGTNYLKFTDSDNFQNQTYLNDSPIRSHLKIDPMEVKIQTQCKAHRSNNSNFQFWSMP